jgi:NAD(P)-dependent dehydrogenase (short-subunit alcohol dehydrogenase family)
VKRVCLLTGASGLLGTAFIERHAPDYTIAAIHNRHPVLFATQDQRFVDPLAVSDPVPANAYPVHAMQADLCDTAAVDRLVDDVAGQFGNIDLLVNLAAIRAWLPLLAPGAADAAEQVLRTNVEAPLRLCITVARRLWSIDPADNHRANRNIVNLSSSAGSFVYPDLGQAAYATSKAALSHLTYHLASEFWNIGVRVNAVSPDTFPGCVSVQDVLEAIVDLDGGRETGRIISLPGTSGIEQEHDSSARS